MRKQRPQLAEPVLATMLPLVGDLAAVTWDLAAWFTWRAWSGPGRRPVPRGGVGRGAAVRVLRVRAAPGRGPGLARLAGVLSRAAAGVTGQVRCAASFSALARTWAVSSSGRVAIFRSSASPRNSATVQQPPPVGAARQLCGSSTARLVAAVPGHFGPHYVGQISQRVQLADGRAALPGVLDQGQRTVQPVALLQADQGRSRSVLCSSWSGCYAALPATL